MAETVAQAIAKYAPNRRVAEAMGLGALLEGGSLGSGPFGVGDNGQSFGPFQIYQVAHHDITPTQSRDPDYAVRYMMGSYVNAAKKVPESLWRTNPELAAEKTAFMAERPLKDYFQTEDVDAKWRSMQGKIPGLGHKPWKLSPGDIGSGGGGVQALGGSLSSLSTATGLSGTVLIVVLAIILVIALRK